MAVGYVVLAPFPPSYLELNLCVPYYDKSMYYGQSTKAAAALWDVAPRNDDPCCGLPTETREANQHEALLYKQDILYSQ